MKPKGQNLELFPEPDAPARERAPSVPPTVSPAAPLPERMRPRSLEEFEGQAGLLGEGGPLGPVLSGKAPLPSLILWGPPGSGKTTLARLLAERAGLRFVALSAVLAGVRDLRAEIEHASLRPGETALFIDEIHRFNKAQQDALLPHVERGTIRLLGATTENPSFEVIPALRSRARVFRLERLDEPHLERIAQRALEDRERGLGSRELRIAADALSLLARLADGDARRALALLESAAARTTETIARGDVEAALESRLPDYDKAGDAHYDVISAFIKSLRGSDPDAALYWLARMLGGGEDPRFILRRMLIFASEDIGNAEPRALQVAVSAAEAFDRVGLPEGRLILSQAVAFLACAPKSNASLLAIARAEQAVLEHGALAVPFALRNAPTELMRREGYGRGYQYPHDHPGHFVVEEYLPERLRGARFYRPTGQGVEAEQRAQLEALWGKRKGGEPEDSGSDSD